MDFHYLTYFINGFMMIAMPIGLTIYLTRKYKQGWRLFWIGAATFIFSQVLHIPFNTLVNPIFNQFKFIALPVVVQTIISAVFLGLSAGLFEELSRFAMYRWVARDARSWSRGLLAGAGHGGVEAIILGGLVLYGYIQMVSLRYADLATVVPAGQLDAVRSQIAAYWLTPWYITLLGALERLFTIPFHLACSILVLQTFTRKQSWWVGLAILYHALVDGTAVFASGMKLSALAIEGIIGIFAISSVEIIYVLFKPEPSIDIFPSQPVNPLIFSPKLIDETEENLDKTRFQ